MSVSMSVFAQTGARLTLDYTVHDRGIVTFKGDGLFKFPYTNTGDKPLIILTVKSSCGCLIGSWRREPLPPGETDTIYGKYATTRIGPINKSLTVQSNDNENPNILLRIKGVVVDDSLRFGFTKLDDKKHTHYPNHSVLGLGSLTSDSVAFQIQNFNPFDSYLDFSEFQFLSIYMMTDEGFAPVQKLFLKTNEEVIIIVVLEKRELMKEARRIEEVIRLPTRELKLSVYFE